MTILEAAGINLAYAVDAFLRGGDRDDLQHALDAWQTARAQHWNAVAANDLQDGDA